MANSSFHFLDLPHDILQLVLRWLTMTDLDNVDLVCKWLRTKCRSLMTCQILNLSLNSKSVKSFMGFHRLCREHNIIRPFLNRVFIQPTISDKPDLSFSALEISNITPIPTWLDTGCLDSLAISMNASSIDDSTEFAHHQSHPLATTSTSCGLSKNLRALMLHRFYMPPELLTICSKFNQLSLLSLSHCEVTTPVLSLNILQSLRVLEIESKYTACYYDLPKGLETCILNFRGENLPPKGLTFPQSVDAESCCQLNHL